MQDYLGFSKSLIKRPDSSSIGPSMTESRPETSASTNTHHRMLELTSRIVSAQLSHNALPANELPALINQVFKAITGLDTGTQAAAALRPEPAVPVKKSVFADYIVCLEDGKKLKLLKRHLMTSYNLTPDAYRKRWSLPPDYPMVAPSYANRRSTLAKSAGLGSKRTKAASE
jgi:predicted transcriptional regulator